MGQAEAAPAPAVTAAPAATAVTAGPAKVAAIPALAATAAPADLAASVCPTGSAAPMARKESTGDRSGRLTTVSERAGQPGHGQQNPALHQVVIGNELPLPPVRSAVADQR
ncbi:hypothetical protein GuangZ0019_2694 [Mycobacterium tuberculosis GuangZ0019]|uniref:Uncharacterized protein n=1 Tax=Mycobacterium tuberculosis CAS/NITR204 TaxID=1310114 RepID=R4M5K4_MYCTX|nr:hypothetical protein J113_10050 [Mycobacterium tuberculosis CAS/NITR204]AOZ42613.1 PE-PGRS family protein [Mycobacterium tuberculosis]EQM19206.1 hypothetical protein GuangZ0019_2694 [Mycobacterium tuberculosis GuangZ0019]KAK27388.1 hypothetical protein AZ55_08555 [Mycobacterium tuberculosis CWCFVRF MDRTB 670]CEJ52673.1 Uncharacterized protein MBO_202923 [Mycobacterium tuberculosis variant caprae]